MDMTGLLVSHCDHQYLMVHKCGKECGSLKCNGRKMKSCSVKNFTTSYFCRGQQFLDKFCLQSEWHLLMRHFGAFFGRRLLAKRYFLRGETYAGSNIQSTVNSQEHSIDHLLLFNHSCWTYQFISEGYSNPCGPLTKKEVLL